jgi:hypothetical protein
MVLVCDLPLAHHSPHNQSLHLHFGTETSFSQATFQNFNTIGVHAPSTPIISIIIVISKTVP